MSTTFAQNLAARERTWALCVKIEGVGIGLSAGDIAATDGDGVTKWWTTIPDYEDSSIAVNRDFLKSVPDIMSERGDILGGMPELGEATVEIVDVDDVLTSLIAPDVAPATYLDEDLDSSETTISVDDASALTITPPDNVAWFGSEAVRITGISSNDLTVVRGYLDTDAIVHSEFDSVFSSVPYLRGRRMEIFLVPIDAADNGEETLVGEYVIDGLDFDDTLNVWRIRGKSQLKYLHRLAPQSVRSGRIRQVFEAVSSTSTDRFHSLQIDPIGNHALSVYNIWSGTEATSGSLYYCVHGDEVFDFTENAVGAIVPRVGRRGLVGTTQEAFVRGEIIRQVCVAEHTHAGTFRYSPGASPSESRSSGTWTKTAHWVDICLCIMTSSAHEDDGLDLTNHPTDASLGNWACLPPGYGIGIPQARIDWDSWMDVKQRTRDYEFPGFWYGGEPVPFADLITEHFLRPIGAYLSSQGGVAKLILPKIPLLGSTTITLGHDEILSREVARGQYLPRVRIKRNYENQTGSLVYEIGPQAEPLVVNSGDYAGTYGQRGLYSIDERPVRIPMPSGIAGDTATQLLAGKMGMRRMFRLHRPSIEIEADADLELFSDAHPGEILGVTLTDAPTLTGSRDMSAFKAEVVQVEPVFDVGTTGKELGGYLQIRGIGYGNGAKVAGIGPSAWITSVSTYTATVTTNRYVHSDAAGTLPTTDAAAFSVGDICRLFELDGELVSGSSAEEITAISGDDITFSGDFDGTLATSKIIAYAYNVTSASRPTGSGMWGDISMSEIKAQWHLIESSHHCQDTSGNNYDATANSHATLYQTGQIDYACLFDGQSGEAPAYWSYIETTSFSVGTDLTLTAWIRVEDASDPLPQSFTILNKSHTSSHYIRLSWYVDAATRKLRFELHLDKTAYGTTELGTDEWYWVAVTIEKTAANQSDVIHYVNGVAEGSATSIAKAVDSYTMGAEPWMIASEKGAAVYGNSFDGKISDVQIIEEVWSAATISTAYSQYTSGGEVEVADQQLISTAFAGTRANSPSAPYVYGEP